jgi:hypothetical protein
MYELITRHIFFFSLQCIYENQTTYSNGVTNIKLAGDKLIVARLNGRLDFLRLETYTQGRQIDWSFTSAYRRSKYLYLFLLICNHIEFHLSSLQHT